MARRLHERVAESGLLPYDEGSVHWLAAGELELACAAAFDAARLAAHPRRTGLRDLAQRVGNRESSPELHASVRLLCTLAAHDLGRVPDSSLTTDVLTDARIAGPEWSWVPVRILTERWRLDEAATADASGQGVMGELATT